MNYSERRDHELLSAPGTIVVPPGPGTAAFWVSVLLAALVAGLFLWRSGEKKPGAEFADDSFNGMGLQRREAVALNNLIRSRHAHAPDAEAGVTENSLRWLPHLTDGDVQPLWPWVMRGAVEEGHLRAGFEAEKDEALLARVQARQRWMIAGFLLLLGVLAGRLLHPGTVLPVLLPATLAALLPYGLNFGPAGLSYILVFLSWVCALRLLHRNSVWLHAVFGVLTGLAWLTDVTALLVVAAWLVAATARWVRICFRRGEQAVHETWIARNHFVGLLVVVMAWVAVCGSRCGAAMDHWGRPLFAWQHHWMWLDSDAEALALRDRFEDARAVGGRRVDLPGWEDYFQTHTAEQARERLASGWSQVWGRFLGTEPPEWPPDLFWKLHAIRQGAWLWTAAGLLVIAAAVAFTRRGPPGQAPVRLPCGSAACVLFVLLATVAYGAWYAWYVPVQSDPRFLLVLYLPLVWSCVWGAEKLMTLGRMRGLSRRGWMIWQGLLWAWSALLTADLLLRCNSTDAVQALFFR